MDKDTVKDITGCIVNRFGLKMGNHPWQRKGGRKAGRAKERERERDACYIGHACAGYGVYGPDLGDWHPG